MPSWERLLAQRSNSKPSDANSSMEDRVANVAWSTLLTADERQGFLIQNTSQSEIRIRVKGENVTGNRLPGYGDSFSPDFEPHKAYEVQADEDGSTFVLTVW